MTRRGTAMPCPHKMSHIGIKVRNSLREWIATHFAL
jgi:hypothetical protein